jgi:hypothetical protein
MALLFDLAVAWLALMFLIYIAFLAIGLNLMPSGPHARVGAGVAMFALFIGGVQPF